MNSTTTTTNQVISFARASEIQKKSLRNANLIDGENITSLIVMGPTGTGKTTLATYLSTVLCSDILPEHTLEIEYDSEKSHGRGAEYIRTIAMRKVIIIDDLNHVKRKFNYGEEVNVLMDILKMRFDLLESMQKELDALKHNIWLCENNKPEAIKIFNWIAENQLDELKSQLISKYETKKTTFAAFVTIITTNLNKAELETKLDYNIVSRLFSLQEGVGCKLIVMQGDDIRNSEFNVTSK